MTVAEKLAEWGIVEVAADRRSVVITRRETHEVTITGRRATFTVECLVCGFSEHASPDDHSVAICLRCGRDRWL